MKKIIIANNNANSALEKIIKIASESNGVTRILTGDRPEQILNASEVYKVLKNPHIFVSKDFTVTMPHVINDPGIEMIKREKGEVVIVITNSAFALAVIIYFFKVLFKKEISITHVPKGAAYCIDVEQEIGNFL